MLDAKRLKEKTLIEELVCKPISELKCNPLTKDQSEYLIRVGMLPDDFDLPQEEKPFVYQVIEKRVEVMHDYTIDSKLLIYLSILCTNPAVGVMMVWYLQYLSKKDKVERFTLNDFIMKYMPDGFPSEDDLHAVWDSQKVKRPEDASVEFSDNAVDHYPAGISVLNVDENGSD